MLCFGPTISNDWIRMRCFIRPDSIWLVSSHWLRWDITLYGRNICILRYKSPFIEICHIFYEWIESLGVYSFMHRLTLISQCSCRLQLTASRKRTMDYWSNNNHICNNNLHECSLIIKTTYSIITRIYGTVVLVNNHLSLALLNCTSSIE